MDTKQIHGNTVGDSQLKRKNEGKAVFRSVAKDRGEQKTSFGTPAQQEAAPPAIQTSP